MNNRKLNLMLSNIVFIAVILCFTVLLACPQQDENVKEDIIMIKNNIEVENPSIPQIPPELSAVPSLPINIDTTQLKLERERYAVDYYKCDTQASKEGNKLVLSSTGTSPSWAIYAIDRIDQRIPVTLNTWKVKATGGPYYVGFSTYAKGGWTIMGPFSIWNIGEFVPNERYTGPDGVAFILVITPSTKTEVEGIEITTRTNPVSSIINPIQRSIAWNQIDGYFEDSINDSWLSEPVEITDFSSKESKPFGAIEVRYQVQQSNNYLFFAVEWPDLQLNDVISKDKSMNFDATSIYLCTGDRTRPQENDDVRTLSPAYRTTYLDQHFDKDDNTADDISMDGLGWCTYKAEHFMHRAEFVVPMIGDGKQDLNINPQKPEQVLVQMQFINNFQIVDKENASMKVAYLRAGESKTTAGWLKIQPEPFNAPNAAARFKGNVVFISEHPQQKGEVYKLELPTGKISQITKNELYENNVSISPDGSWCAFSVANSNDDLKSYEIARINLNGSGYQTLTHNELLDGHPAISPDGKTIAFARYNRDNAADIFLIPASGGSARQLTDSELDINDPEWFPDGKRLIVKTHNPAAKNVSDVIQILNVEDGKLTEQITMEKDKANDHDPIVSPDGSQIAFMRFMLQKDWNQHMTEAPWQLFYTNLADPKTQQITDFLGINSLPVWANENELLFIRSVGPGYTQLWLTTKNGLQQSELLHTIPRLRYFDFKP